MPRETGTPQEPGTAQRSYQGGMPVDLLVMVGHRRIPKPCIEQNYSLSEGQFVSHKNARAGKSETH